MPRSSPLRVTLDRIQPADSDHQVYMGADAGPFRCDRCTWYGPAARCSEPHIVIDARRGLYGLRSDGTRAIVEADGCSDYFNPQKAGQRAEVS